jgi:hypothetical protein
METTDKVNPIEQLSDEALSQQLTDCRITLESIYPYTCRDVSQLQSQLRSEYNRRHGRNQPFPKGRW